MVWRDVLLSSLGAGAAVAAVWVVSEAMLPLVPAALLRLRAYGEQEGRPYY